MSDSIRLTKSEAQFVMKATGRDNINDAVEVFVELMSKEGIPSYKLLKVVKLLMERNNK